MRTFITMALIITVSVWVLAGCGGNKTEPAQPGTTATAPTQPAAPVIEPLKVGEKVFVSVFDLPNSRYDTATIATIEGDMVDVKWDDNILVNTPTEKRKMQYVIRVQPITAAEAVPGVKVMIKGMGQSDRVNFPGEIVSVKDGVYSVKYMADKYEKVGTYKLEELKGKIIPNK